MFKDDSLVKYARQVQNRVKGGNMKLENKTNCLIYSHNH